MQATNLSFTSGLTSWRRYIYTQTAARNKSSNRLLNHVHAAVHV